LSVVNSLLSSTQQQAEDIHATSEAFGKKEGDALSAQSSLLESKLGLVQDRLKKVLCNEDESEQSIKHICDIVQDVRSQSQAFFATWSSHTQEAISKMSEELEAATKQKLDSVSPRQAVLEVTSITYDLSGSRVHRSV